MPRKHIKGRRTTSANRARAKTAVLARTFGPLLTVAEVAEELQVHRRKVTLLIDRRLLAWIDLGEAPGRRIIRVGRHQLDEYIAACVRPMQQTADRQ